MPPHAYDDLLKQAFKASTKIVGVATDLKDYTLANGNSWRGDSNDALWLAQRSGLDKDLYAMARCATSEESSPAEAILAVCECVRNESDVWPTANPKRSPFYMLTQRRSDSYKETAGKFGEQTGCWASTARAPTERHVAIARIAWEKKSDFTRGARRFFSAKLQDTGKQGNRTLSRDAIGIVKKWASEGWQWIGHLPNVDSYEFMCFRLVDTRAVANTEAAEKMILAGRTGEPQIPSLDSLDPNARRVAALGLPSAWLYGAWVV